MRTATKADLNAITNIIWAGFPDDPGCDYKFPYRHEYEDDFRQWTSAEYGEYIEQPEKFAVHVVDAPFTGEGGASFSEPIAIGVWDTAALTDSTGGGKRPSQSYSATRCKRGLTRSQIVTFRYVETLTLRTCWRIAKQSSAVTRTISRSMESVSSDYGCWSSILATVATELARRCAGGAREKSGEGDAGC